jgi:hypothetical protein
MLLASLFQALLELVYLLFKSSRLLIIARRSSHEDPWCGASQFLPLASIRDLNVLWLNNCILFETDL